MLRTIPTTGDHQTTASLDAAAVGLGYGPEPAMGVAARNAKLRTAVPTKCQSCGSYTDSTVRCSVCKRPLPRRDPEGQEPAAGGRDPGAARVEGQPPPTNGMAVASLVTGLIGFSLFGLVFGFVALSQIRRYPHQQGRGLALAGIWISLAWAAAGVVWVVWLLAAF